MWFTLYESTELTAGLTIIVGKRKSILIEYCMQSRDNKSTDKMQTNVKHYLKVFKLPSFLIINIQFLICFFFFKATIHCWDIPSNVCGHSYTSWKKRYDFENVFKIHFFHFKQQFFWILFSFLRGYTQEPLRNVYFIKIYYKINISSQYFFGISSVFHVIIWLSLSILICFVS